MEGAYQKDVEEVTAYFNVDLNNGLTDADVSTARARYGPNELPVEEATPMWKLLLRQFDDTLVKILLAAAVVDFLIAITDGETFLSSLIEPSVIILILIANATVGVVTERNAETAIEQLKAYEADNATVLRGGRVQLVPASQLVPGDVVEVAVGGKVPADVRIAVIYSAMLRVDQSILTGESDSVMKTAAAVTDSRAVIQDKVCMLFSGTMVTSGRARGIVVATGQQTAIGKIRDALSDQEEVQTPLKQKLDEFGTLLSKVIAAICVLVWLINIRRFWDPSLGGPLHGAVYYFKIAVALAVAAIPEGLPAVVTTCLALGTRKMAAQRAIVRKLPSVETLGCTTVICTDKTGTLTTNTMSVVKAASLQATALGLAEYDITGNSLTPDGEVMTSGGARVSVPAQVPGLLSMAMCGALCNDSTLSYSPTTGAYQRIGESTEVALRVFAEKVGIPPNGFAPPASQQPGPVANKLWQERWHRMYTLDFSRDRKMMSVLCTGGGMATLFTKGAPEVLMQRCTSVLASSGEGAVPLTQEVRNDLTACMQRWGGEQALRCLALACKPMPTSQTSLSISDEDGLTLVGLVGLHDPPRRECRAAVEACRAAGIRVIAVTGDNRATAEAVCRQVGIIDPLTDYRRSLDAVISCTGQEFDDMKPSQKIATADSLLLLSRVEPLHKLRLVELLQAQGHIVAMTGDGVNDAPALRKADIGVAMGSGTAVARHASDMVLADDNFASIVAAVAEGRAIYGNMKQFIRYMISSNIGEVVAIFVAALLGIPEVLSPVQLLWVNLVTDGLPATALGFNRPDGDVMRLQPRRVDEPIVNGWLFLRYLVVGLYVGLVTVAGFTWWFVALPEGPGISWRDLSNFQACETMTHAMKDFDCSVFTNKHPRTIAMTVLVVVEMFNALNNLSENCSLLRVPPWSNRWLLAAISTSMALHFFILYVPAAAALFGVTALSLAEWRLVLWLSAPVILVDEVMKYISRRFSPSGWKLFSRQQRSPQRRKGVASLDSLNILEIVTGGSGSKFRSH